MKTWGEWMERTKAKRFHFALLMTGGTIVSVPNPHGALEPAKNPKELLRFAPHLLDLADLDIIPVMNKDSSNMTVEDWKEISLAIIKYHNMYDGFLLTHGTDTITYSASAVRFAIGENLYNPIVFTGSQLPINVERTDAITNIEDALAALMYARQHELKEVMIVAGREVHRAVRAVKISEAAFRFIDSPVSGPIGNSTAIGVEFRPNRVFIVDPGPSKSLLPWSNGDVVKNAEQSLAFDNKILTIRLQPNSGRQMLEETFKQREGFPFSAVIMSALGTGNPPVWSLPLIENLIKQNIPVIIAPPETGMSTKLIYESARQASELGAIQSGDMISPAATVKLSYLLANQKTKSLQELKKLFVKNYYGEIS